MLKEEVPKMLNKNKNVAESVTNQINSLGKAKQ